MGCGAWQLRRHSDCDRDFLIARKSFHLPRDLFELTMQPVSSLMKSTTLALSAALLTFSSHVFAAGLQVTPISLQIPVGRQAEGIWLLNTSQEPLSAQVRVFQWLQKDGEDLLAPTSTLTISPPLIDIPPGGRQLVRVLRTGPAPAAGLESSYRLIVDELPTETQQQARAQADANSSGKAKLAYGMNFLMRYSVPVFVGDATEEDIKAASAQLRWNISKQNDQWTIEVQNNGTIRTQLADLQAIDASGNTMPVSNGMLGYVLPGSSMRWSIPAPPLPSPVKGWQAMVNSDVQRINVPASR